MTKSKSPTIICLTKNKINRFSEKHKASQNCVMVNLANLFDHYY